MNRFFPSETLSMRSAVARKFILCAVWLGLLPVNGFAAGAGGEYAPIAAPGIIFHAGDAGKSLTGASGYLLRLGAEKRKGFLRPNARLEIEYSSGTASVGDSEPDFTLFHGGFHGGLNLFIFTTGRFQAFVGGAGVASWSQLQLTSPPDGVEENTQSLSFGYETSAGVDMRLGSAEGNAIRLESSFYSVSSGLAGEGSFQLQGFKFLLGIVF